MIARRIPPKETRAGGFARLGQYITAAILSEKRPETGPQGVEALGAYIADQAGHDDRVEWTRITNCQFADSVKGAVAEIAATQDKNTRMKADPNYHLLVSFPPGEVPTREQIEDIEDTLVQGLGLSAHQRISALHADKAHLHLHVAINLIHPETFVAAKIWQDHTKLNQMAASLEKKHGLALTNHEFPGERGKARLEETARMEAHTGREMFTSWVKRVAGEEIKAAGAGQGGWQALQETAARYGLEFRQRGAGVVIGKIGEPALNMKASALGRELGYKQLVERFGPYEAAGEKARAVKPETNYTRTVPPEQRATNGLWEKYVAERDAALRARADLDGPAKQYIRDLNAHYKAEFAKVKNWRTEMFDPRIRIQTLKRNRERDMARYLARTKAQRADLASNRPVKSWPEWLRDEAGKGNQAAADELRRQAAKVERFTNVLVRTPPGAAGVVRDLDLKPKATRGGDIVYRMPDGGTVVDTKDGLQMPMASRAAAVMILDMARERAANQPLSVNGTTEQAAAILEAAVQLRADITFADPGLEAERQRRMAEPIEAQGRRIYLSIPYAEREEARELGARWDKEAKAWWITPRADPAPFAKWHEDITAVVRSKILTDFIADRSKWREPGDTTEWRQMSVEDQGMARFVSAFKVGAAEIAVWRTNEETIVQDITGFDASPARFTYPGMFADLQNVMTPEMRGDLEREEAQEPTPEAEEGAGLAGAGAEETDIPLPPPAPEAEPDKGVEYEP